jgi:hypothetical protein
MNGELNLISVFPRIIAPGRIARAKAPAASRMLKTDKVTGEIVALGEPHHLPGVVLAELRVGDFWETFSFGVVGLCGWVAVGLSFG